MQSALHSAAIVHAYAKCNAHLFRRPDAAAFSDMHEVMITVDDPGIVWNSASRVSVNHKIVVIAVAFVNDCPTADQQLNVVIGDPSIVYAINVYCGCVIRTNNMDSIAEHPQRVEFSAAAPSSNPV